MTGRALPTINGVDVRPFAYRVNDAGKMLGVGRSTIFEMIRTGTLEARKIVPKPGRPRSSSINP